MKHLFTKMLVVLLGFLTLGAVHAWADDKGGDSYGQMWKKVRTAFNNDLPKTALEGVKDIRTRAAAEGNDPQLLRALCTEFTLAHEISPDSDAVVQKRIEAAFVKETRPVERALWQSALGQISRDPVLLLASVSDIEPLAQAKAKAYVPAFAIGEDSYVFNDDVLHVLLDVVTRYPSYGKGSISDSDKVLLCERVRKVYEAQQNDFMLLAFDFRYRSYLRGDDCKRPRLMERIRELQSNGLKADKRHHANVMKHMKLWADGEEAPLLNASWDWTSRINYPGMERALTLYSRNVSRAEVRFYRIEGLTNQNWSSSVLPKDYKPKKGAKQLVKTLSSELQHVPSYESFRDTLRFQLPDEGIYIVELLADGKLRDMQWLAVSHLMAMTTHHNSVQGSKSRMILVDSRTGQPFTTDARVDAFVDHKTPGTYASDYYWDEVPSDGKGAFDVSDYNNRTKMAISAGSDKFYPPFEHSAPYWGHFSVKDVVDTRGRLFTDRAIYRPGQKVMVSGIVYSRFNDNYKASEDWTGTLQLLNTERKEIAHLDVKTDEYGQFTGEFTLPSPTIPGRFSLELHGNGVNVTEYISVEEYKRPTFRVILDAADPMVLLGKERYEKGDTLVVNGRVESFSGVPVAEAKVHWTSSCTDWGWRYRGDDGSSAESAEAKGDVVSDADGRFVIKMGLKDTGYYRISCEALASNGETASESMSLYVGYPIARKDETVDATERLQLFAVTTSKAGDEATLKIDFRALPAAQRCAPYYVFYDVVTTQGGLVENTCRVSDGEQMTFDLKWKEEYGDGAKAYVAFIKNGEFYTTEMAIQKPLPDKQLKLEWSTFRDKLQPGQDETWTLTVKRPDGSPADARVVARLYDASLDAFTKNPWSFNLDFTRFLPSIYASREYVRPNNLSWEMSVPSPMTLNFTTWEPTMFDYYAMMRARYAPGRGERRLAKGVSADGGVFYALESAPAPMAMPYREAPMAREEEAMDMAVNESDAAEAMQMKVRENFDETAFFLPALRTDAEGNVTINFTLPESLTQWNFSALAHEKNMNYGLLNDTIVAQKKLMTEIAAPRFLRAGDKTEIPVTVRNLTETELQGELIFLVTDAVTGKPLKTEKRTFTLASTKSQDAAASQTTLFFAINPTTDVNVRAVAKAADFSDGEERNIPFLDGRETVQVSVPFSSTQKGNVRLDLSPLKLGQLMKKDAACKPVLTLEYCDNPVWNVVRVVPALLEGEAYSANDWAVRLYTIEVADFLSRKLKNTESAALIDSLVCARDIPALRYSALDRLADYQRGDGGFSWFKGFYSSSWITADVCVLLAREQMMTGSRTANTMLQRAMKFMEKVADEEVKRMKKNKDTTVSEVMLRYLYARELMGLAPGKDEKFLLDLAAKEKKDLTMHGKSLLSQIAMATHKADAVLALESLVEHTVCTPEMGRYFDTQRAFGGWASYKIPTQTMAIEALGSAAKVGVTEIQGLTGKQGDPDNVATTLDLQNQMKLWLLQSKRTQKWESSRASADATYALLHGDCRPDAPSQLFQTLAPENYSKRELTPEEAERAIKSGSYNINKESDGLSWGALYADYTLPVEMVEASSAGFTISRSWEVLRDGKWVAIPASSAGQSRPFALKVGEHVRQTITLRAERDYDFVQVECSRAACLEPLTPLSGICWLGQTQAYRMVRDSSNAYFFEHFAKGTHTFTEELIVDRSGTFTTGIAHVQCTFAPEFGGYAPSTVLKVSK